MRTIWLLATALLLVHITHAQQTNFEKTDGRQSATYFEAISFYKQLSKASPLIQLKEMGSTDAGYPLHLVLVSSNKQFAPTQWHQQKKVVIMINNGIHAGEPDGIDASMMLVRDIASGKLPLPANVCLGIIPVYNVGGALNRTPYSRVSQNGPEEYGFRGNSQNLNLNRDFTKAEALESRSFIKAFHWLNPDILIDNHVSDGADFQHTMTLITTQPDKLGGELGNWVKNSFEPSLYKGMDSKGWQMCPYVDFVNTDINKGMVAFYDNPRYSTGYAALWQTIAFMPETHMLKPFKDRTLSTYSLMQTMIEQASKQATDIIALRSKAIADVSAQSRFPLAWKQDTVHHQKITFKGYEKNYKTSAATGLQQMFYDHTKPYTKEIPYYNTYTPQRYTTAPAFYIIPQGWHTVLDILKANQVQMKQLKQDSTLSVTVYKIKELKALPSTFEAHHTNSLIATDTTTQKIQFLKGDYLIPVNQPANRYLVEMLEPGTEDGFFTWNFFDAILQQKEGYTDYRWEELAADWLKKNPELQQTLNTKRSTDSNFAKDSRAQLNWIYKNSPYYEPAHNRYPVFRIEAKQ